MHDGYVFLAICFTWLLALSLIAGAAMVIWTEGVKPWLAHKRWQRAFRRPAKRIAKLWTD